MLFMGHQIIILHHTKIHRSSKGTSLGHKVKYLFRNDTNKQDSFLLAYLEKSTLNKCKEKSRSDCICSLVWSSHATYQWKHGPRAKSCRHAAINNLMNSQKLSNCHIRKPLVVIRKYQTKILSWKLLKNEQKLSLGIKIQSHMNRNKHYERQFIFPWQEDLKR